MKTSLELLKEAKITPKLRLGQKTAKGVVSTGQHRVKILKDKVAERIEPKTGKKKEVVRYLVEENGQHKFYEVDKMNKDGTELHYLVQRLAEIPEDTEIILEMKKAGIKNYIEVTELGRTDQVEYEDDEPQAETESPDETHNAL